MRWISQPVCLEWDHEHHTVAAVWWNERRWPVTEILSDGRRVDFRARWWQRRHHRRLIVRTADQRVFELRGERPGQWILYREWDQPWD